MRVLFLEDEEAIRGFVRINLKRNGMEVTEAEDGETALALAKSAVPPFDIALLDVMLPTISGFDVCEQLRQLFPRMGIIMLTAKSQEEDKIRGLELGADDYVQKPFSPGELIARLNALKRRMMPYGEEQAGVDGSAIAGEAGLSIAGSAGAANAEAGAGPGAEAASPERNGLSAYASEGATGWQAGHAAGAAGQAPPNAATSANGGSEAAGAGNGAYAAERAGNGMLAGVTTNTAGGSASANAGRNDTVSQGMQPDRPNGVPSGAAANAAGFGAAPNSGHDAGLPGLPDSPGSATAAGQHNGSPGQPDYGTSGTSDALAAPQIGSAASPDTGEAQPSFHRAAARPYHRPARAGDIDSGPFLLSAAERRLWKDGAEIVLTPTEWTLVKLLMEREGEGLSRDDILNAVWGRHYVGDLKIVDVNIRRIRQKIEIKPSDPKHIETLWGYGYRWNRSGGL